MIEEIEVLGGMTKAIEAGIPKIRIEEAAARKQARIDSGQDIIVGVNKYQLEKEDAISTLEVDNQTVRNSQIERLNQVKSSRNSEEVAVALSKLTKAAKTGRENLLALAIEAARERATLGEISDALEEEFGRYKAQIKSFSGVYSKEIKDDESFKKAKELADIFAEQDGRRPRIMIAKMGQDGHDRRSGTRRFSWRAGLLVAGRVVHGGYAGTAAGWVTAVTALTTPTCGPPLRGQWHQNPANATIMAAACASPSPTAVRARCTFFLTPTCLTCGPN